MWRKLQTVLIRVEFTLEQKIRNKRFQIIGMTVIGSNQSSIEQFKFTLYTLLTILK